MVRSSVVAFGALVFPRASAAQGADSVGLEASVEAECAGLTECGSCVDTTLLGVHKCHWCEVDLECHAVGSVFSTCAPSLENDHCVSKASLSGCGESECTAGDDVRPRHVHLALAGPTGMRVMWKVDGPTERCSVALDTGSSVEVVATELENRRQYIAGHGYHHVATLAGLTPGSDYSYYVDCEGWASATKSFHVPATDRSEASFLVVGDLATLTKGAGLSRERMRTLKNSTDLTVHVGDIGYADDSFLHVQCVTEFCYEAVNDMYMDGMEDHFNDKPYMVAPGNHESECHSPACLISPEHKDALRNFSAYNSRWAMPSKESGGSMNMWYSFDYGPVHFVSANTETDFEGATSEHYGDGGRLIGLKAGGFAPDGEYLRWLEADLAAANANRAERPWIVAYGHRTWFYRDHRAKDKNSMNAHKPLFEKYGVDLYMAGHVHAYSRHTPAPGSGEVPVVVTGAAGCEEGLEGWGETKGVADDGFEYYSTGQVYQVGTIDVSREALTWKAHNSETGEIFDTFTLTKQALV